jgi:hypothetical protein
MLYSLRNTIWRSKLKRVIDIGEACSTYMTNAQEDVGRTNRLLSLILHRPHRKRCIQHFFYCCMCIRCRGNVLPSRCLATIRVRHIDTQTDGTDL